jgi:Flp pilus assembly protein TadD
MKLRRTYALRSSLLALVFPILFTTLLPAQATPGEPAPPVTAASSLGLPDALTASLQQALDAHDYLTAEKILLAEIDRDPHGPGIARLLAFAGTVYFLNQDFLNAAVAWKKSEAIAPLDPRLQFSLAMAYVRIHHSEWARPLLEALTAHDPNNAVYPFWLGRLDYDKHEYNGAIRHFQHAIELDSTMARAYDNLGLCYYYQNQNTLAVTNYNKAIALERNTPHPSPWPYLNLAITQQFLNQLQEAEANLRQALQLDPQFAQAHFQLGTVLEDLGRNEEAVTELRQAAALDAAYAEPHMALARIYHKLGRAQDARAEVDIYLHLHPHSTPTVAK